MRQGVRKKQPEGSKLSELPKVRHAISAHPAGYISRNLGFRMLRCVAHLSKAVLNGISKAKPAQWRFFHSASQRVSLLGMDRALLQSTTPLWSTGLAAVTQTTRASAAVQVPALGMTSIREFHIKKQKSKRVRRNKMKSHRATLKRFSVTGTGLIMRWKNGKRHLLRKKSPRQLRRLDHKVEIPKQYYQRYRRSMPYSF